MRGNRAQRRYFQDGGQYVEQRVERRPHFSPEGNEFQVLFKVGRYVRMEDKGNVIVVSDVNYLAQQVAIFQLWQAAVDPLNDFKLG